MDLISGRVDKPSFDDEERLIVVLGSLVISRRKLWSRPLAGRQGGRDRDRRECVSRLDPERGKEEKTREKLERYLGVRDASDWLMQRK